MSNLLKGVTISYQQDSRRVIDSNELVATKIERLANLMSDEEGKSDSFSDGFTEGILASRVDELLEDDMEEYGDESGNVIKAEAEAEKTGPSAEELLEQARYEAQSIIEDAIRESEEKKEQVYEQAKQAGYQEGYQQGIQEAESMKAELEQYRIQLDRDYQNQIDELEPMFIETLTGIYEHIFHIKLTDSKEIIFYLIQDAVRKVEGNKNFIIHVSKEDYGFVSMQKKELLSGIASAEGAEIVEDMTLKKNECFIETGGGIFDCSLETQLTGLARELKLLSYVKPSNG